MGSKAPDIHRLTLMVLRLMDADILPLAEGNALLAEIQALVLTPDQAAAQEEADRGEHFPQAGEAPAQMNRLDASPRVQTPESVHRVPRDAAEPR